MRAAADRVRRSRVALVLMPSLVNRARQAGVALGLMAPFATSEAQVAIQVKSGTTWTSPPYGRLRFDASVTPTSGKGSTCSFAYTFNQWKFPQ